MVRAGWDPYPPVFSTGSGARACDADGRKYVDYLMGLGPLLLGHRDSTVTAAVCAAVSDIGTCPGLTYQLEVEAAQKVVEMVPGIDMLRFCNSGSEAAAAAVRLARVYTGRTLLVKFEGHYHGSQDVVYWKGQTEFFAEQTPSTTPVPAGPGVPSQLAPTVVILPWNDRESITRLVDERGAEIAAVITEPIMMNAGVIEPETGYLAHLKSETRRCGALLIFDEVITGFRLCPGGAQEYYNIFPDITILAKGLGGGFPVAAFGGSREVMSPISAGAYSHSGTYNANVVQAAAVSATMDILREPGVYTRTAQLCRELIDAIQSGADDVGVPASVAGISSVLHVRFSRNKVRDWRDASTNADPKAFAKWHSGMLRRGVLFHPNQFEVMFLSLAHTEEDIADTIVAATDTLLDMARRDDA